MPRYILVSFVLMGWAFYELSGGSDFAPTVSDSPGEKLTSVPVEMTPLERAREARAEQTIARATANEPPPAPRTVTPDATTTEIETSVAERPQQADDALRVTLPNFASVTGADDTIEQLQTISLNGLSDIARTADPAPQPEADTVTRSSNAIATSDTTPVRAPLADTADMREIIASRVNMRAGPSTDHDILDQLLRGARVEVLGGNDRGWLRLRTVPGDRVGWIAERLVSEAVN